MEQLEMDMRETLLTLTSDIVAAHVSNNDVAPGEVKSLIEDVYARFQVSGGRKRQRRTAP